MTDENAHLALKKRRTTLKSSCTRIRTYVDSVRDVFASVAAQLQERRLKLDQYWSEYNQIQLNLELIDESETNDRATFEDAFYGLCAKIRELLSPSSFTSRNATASPSTSSVRELSDNTMHVRLPKLNLPTFSGSYDEWFPFHDNFNSVIHTNVSLNNVQKFQYLKASLTGDAGNVINALEMTDGNYAVAWTLLCERYDNKRVIVENHVKALVDTPHIIKENAKELRKLADDASKHLHALQAMKCPTAHWDDLLVYILKSKLDKVTLREWQASLTGTERPTLKQFLDFVAHQCQTLEATDRSGGNNTKNIGAKHPPSDKRQSSCAATVKINCYYCKGNHSIYNCKDFLALSVSRRISEIRSRKVCLNCLRATSHTSAKCTSEQCKVCHQKHNTLLHLESALVETADKNASKSEDSKSVSASSTVATYSSDPITNDNILLSTALIYVPDSEGTLMPCRALLDCGSQANFISSKFLSMLKINPRRVNMSISGVGGTATTSTRAARIRVQSRLSSYNADIECIVTDSVTDKLPACSFSRGSFEFPRNIKLADPRFHESSDIDIVIGTEIFWDTLSVGRIKASSRHPAL
ncbi:hypothetical protein ALC57_18595 [Trachymyrmex cornetzi]|uniref:Uncharacterized protein n=1 Tax=Trachymyrmex cornetzi TaxID=471704 RepID=A0A151IRH4_9HYME|nr:hypothetical protein ALC57_18595 [Trachymyrmex cornetzi]